MVKAAPTLVALVAVGLAFDLASGPAAVPGQTAAPPATPTTLVVSPGGVFGVAQDGARMAWLDCAGKSAGVRFGTPGASFARIDMPFPAAYCGTGVGLAVAGDRLLWAYDVGGNTREVPIYTATVDDTRARRIDFVSMGAGGYGAYFGGMAGDGATLAYTKVAIWRRDEADEAAGLQCIDGELVACRYGLLGGRTATVSSAGARTLVRRGGSVIAAGGGLVAVARPGGLTGVPTAASAADIGPCACTYTPRWSPDGTLLAFASGTESSGASLYMADADGRRPMRITRGSTLDLHPAWSPDGTLIAFHRVPLRADHKVVRPTIYVVGADGRGMRRLGAGRDPAWSHTGTRIAFARDGRDGGIYTMSPAGASIRRLVGPGRYGVFRSPSWSSDDKQIAYLAQDCSQCVYLVPPTGGTPRRIETGHLGLRTVEWSNEGDSFLLSGDLGVFVRGVTDGSDTRLLPSGRGSFASWSPDDARIVMTRWAGGALQVFSLTRATRVPRQLTSLRRRPPRVPVEVRRAPGGALVAAVEPAGDVRGLAVSTDRLVALLVNGGHASLEAYSLRTGRLLGKLRVPMLTARDTVAGRPGAQLSLAGSTLVFNAGRSIRTWNLRTGAPATIATARALPVGLSIERDRVLWAENFGLGYDAQGNATGRGEIRSFTLG